MLQVVEITPIALQNIGYKTYIIFAICNLVAAVVVYCFYPETSYLSLEAVDLLFLPDENRDREAKEKQKFYHRALQWDIVPKARIMVNEAKAARKLQSSEQGQVGRDTQVVKTGSEKVDDKLEVQQIESLN
jgi:hypothetical protein